MHAGPEEVVEIVHVGILGLARVVDCLLRLRSVLVDDDGDRLLVKCLHDTPFVGRVLLQSVRCRLEVVGERAGQF